MKLMTRLSKSLQSIIKSISMRLVLIWLSKSWLSNMISARVWITCSNDLHSLRRSINAAMIDFDVPCVFQLHSQMMETVDALPHMSEVSNTGALIILSLCVQQWTGDLTRMLAMAEQIDMRFDELVSDCSLASAAWVHVEMMDRGGNPGSCVEVAATCHLEDSCNSWASPRMSALAPRALEVESWIVFGQARQLSAASAAPAAAPGLSRAVTKKHAKKGKQSGLGFSKVVWLAMPRLSQIDALQQHFGRKLSADQDWDEHLLKHAYELSHSELVISFCDEFSGD